MKKGIWLVAAAVLTLALFVGCGSDSEDVEEGDSGHRVNSNIRSHLGADS